MTIIYRFLLLSVCLLFIMSNDPPAISMAEIPEYDVAKPDQVVRLWPGDPPTWKSPEIAESDTSKLDSRKQAGKSVIRIGNVSVPQLHVYHPASGPSETVVLVCPGGGYSILAWDLEGTEIATWLSGHGVSAVVLKYRVPTRSEAQKWLAPVQDIQRAIAVVRGENLTDLKPSRVGVLGFSAGGNASARAALATKRFYEPVDTNDEASFKPDFAVLVYPAWLNQNGSSKMIDDLHVSDQSPPMFLAHATDDHISSLSSVAVYSALKQNGVSAEMHLFASGGHGFGGRVANLPTDAWRTLCMDWIGSKN